MSESTDQLKDQLRTTLPHLAVVIEDLERVQGCLARFLPPGGGASTDLQHEVIAPMLGFGAEMAVRLGVVARQLGSLAKTLDDMPDPDQWLRSYLGALQLGSEPWVRSGPTDPRVDRLVERVVAVWADADELHKDFTLQISDLDYHLLDAPDFNAATLEGVVSRLLQGLTHTLRDMWYAGIPIPPVDER